MKRTTLSLPVAAVFLLAAFNLFAQDEVAAPEYHAGDFWQFRVTEKDLPSSTASLNGDYEVMSSGGKFIAHRPGGEQPEGRQEYGLLFSLLSNPTNEMQFLQFPLSVGKKWSVNYDIQLRGSSRPAGRHADTRVTAVEEIATPAGKFRAFKIERYDTGGGGNVQSPVGNFVYTYYYSPETRSVVKYRYQVQAKTGTFLGTREIELVKFGSKLPK